MPASGPVSRRSSPIMRLMSVDLPAVRAPDDRDLSGLPSLALILLAPRPLRPEIGQEQRRRARPMPSPCSAENGTGSPSPKREGVVGAGRPGAALGLVGDEHHRLAGAAHELGEGPVGGQHAGARVDHEEDDVGLGDRRLGLRRACAACSEPSLRLLEAGGVDDAEARGRRAAPSPSRRSRVTPGRSSTSASFWPTRRLKRVDLPTFGRPTMATVAVMAPLAARYWVACAGPAATSAL